MMNLFHKPFRIIKNGFIGFGFLAYYACQNPGTVHKISQLIIPSLNLKNQNHKDSLAFQSPYTFHKESYHLGLFSAKDSTYFENYHLEKGNHWTLLGKSRFKNMGSIIQADTGRIKDSIYLLVIYQVRNRYPGSNLYFSLVNPFTKKVYTIRYRFSGEKTNLSAHYQMDASMKAFPIQIAELEKKAGAFSQSKSGVVKESSVKTGNNYISPNESTLKSVDSYIKRWVMLNDRVYDETNTMGHNFQLNIEESTGDIGPKKIDYQNIDSVYKKNVVVIENGQYRISSLVKGPVYCFNKSQNKSYLIYVPDFPDHYIKALKWRGNSVQLFDSILVPKSKLKPIFEFNLGQKTIKKVK